MAVEYRIDTPGNISECLSMHARMKPFSLAFTFLEKDGVEQSSVTFGELDFAARKIARTLSYLPFQSRIILALPSGIEFIQAFMGCLYAGMIAIPAYPPEGSQKRNRLYAIAKDCNAALVIASHAIKNKYENRFIDNTLDSTQPFKKTPWIAIEDLLQSVPLRRTVLPVLAPHNIAFLQYTSGSTGSPKGVAISHENLLSNQQMIAEIFQHNINTVFASWLPLFHDMGLVGNILQPLYLGIPCYFMSPLTFIEKPVRWLNAISKYKVTTTGSPNFGYDLCIKRITKEQIASLDLSSWTIAYNGAEPVKATTIDAFFTKFHESGFSRTAMFPVYGMAEATLLISGGKPGTGPNIRYANKSALTTNRLEWINPGNNIDDINYQALVGNGHAANGLTIKIVDPNTSIECAADTVGEIWLKGKSISIGYFNKDELNSKFFNQHILNGSADQQYFRTGDLGTLSDGQVFITGRLKDIIIVRGKNHYPQDLEQTISTSTNELCLDGCAVFSWDDQGTERIVAVQEVEKQWLRTFDTDFATTKIQNELHDDHGIRVDAILWVKPATIPRTTSGKISRTLCKQKYLAGQLHYFSVSCNTNVCVIPERETRLC